MFKENKHWDRVLTNVLIKFTVYLITFSLILTLMTLKLTLTYMYILNENILKPF